MSFRAIPVLFLVFLVSFSVRANAGGKEEPLAAGLFVIHENMPEGGAEVANNGKTKKGFVAAKPDVEIKVLADVVMMAPKVMQRGPDGKMAMVDGEADLLLNFRPEETKKIEALHKTHGDAELFLRIRHKGKTRFFDAEFAPISDDTTFVEGSAKEKKAIATLLRRLVRRAE